jgi:hypothetical protein
MSELNFKEKKLAKIPGEKTSNSEGFYTQLSLRIGFFLTIFGFVVFLIGDEPSMFGLDRSPVMGFVQLSVILLGLGLICIGGYTAIRSLWRNKQPTIAADIGLRLVSTGFVVTLFAAMADIIGFGSHRRVPYFGHLQATGVFIGEMFIAVGFLLIIPYSQYKLFQLIFNRKV